MCDRACHTDIDLDEARRQDGWITRTVAEAAADDADNITHTTSTCNAIDASGVDRTIG